MDMKIFAQTYDSNVVNQTYNILSTGMFDNKKIRIMPDTHVGMDCVVGFTAEMDNKINPNIVGVDIGCGVNCTKFNSIDIDFKDLDDYIRQNIPSGMNTFKSYSDLNKVQYNVKYNNYDYIFDMINKLYCYSNLKKVDRLIQSFGTLGGGNHFIEIDIDNKNNKYLVIHSGSRNLGLQVCNYYVNVMKNSHIIYKQDMANEIDLTVKLLTKNKKTNMIQNEIKKIREKYSNIKTHSNYLEGDFFDEYIHDIKIVQNYAIGNREKMKKSIMNHFNLNKNIIDEFESIHNYIDTENNIVRKGAISANKDQKVIIPINMADGSIIGLGKGNADWNYSAPHGAGRLMSRTEAKKYVDMTDYIKSMDGIFTTSVCQETIDESPMVYRNIDEIKNAITDTVDIIDIIKPIYNFKAK